MSAVDPDAMHDRTGDPAIAKRIAEAREAARLTHKEVALRLPGRDERYVYQAAQGIRGVRPQDLVALAQALETTTCSLLGDGDHGVDGVLPGWGELTPDQQTLIRQNVAMLAGEEERRQANVDETGTPTHPIGDPADFDSLDDWVATLPEVTQRTVTAVLDFQNRRSTMWRGRPSGGGEEERVDNDEGRGDPRGGAR